MRDDATGLARRYRTLLLAYPREYRRDRGDEIIGTLLEMAPPGRRWPTVRQSADLIRAGLRCQLGRPGSKMIVFAAAIAAVFAAFLGAGAGAWLGWQPARALPDRATTTAIERTVVPGQRPAASDREDALFYYNDPTNASVLLFGSEDYVAGGDYANYGLAGGDARDFMRAARERLRVDGWHVGYLREEGEQRNGRAVAMFAVKDGLEMTVTFAEGTGMLDTSGRNAPNSLDLKIERGAPGSVLPSAVAGALLGALAGWLLVGWISRRTAGRSTNLQQGALLCGIGAYLGVLPALWAYGEKWVLALTDPRWWEVTQYMLMGRNQSMLVMWEPLVTPSGRFPAILGILALLGAVALAALAREPAAVPENPASA